MLSKMKRWILLVSLFPAVCLAQTFVIRGHRCSMA